MSQNRPTASSAVKTKIQPRGGRSTIPGQIQLWKDLSAAGADILPLTIDSNTRLQKLDQAKRLYNQAISTGVETLNGFPLLSVSLEEAQNLINESGKPVSLRHGTPFASKLVERALSAGVSEVEGGPLTYSLPYSRDTDLVSVISDWEVSEKLCAHYSRETGQKIIRESFGVLTACMVHPIQALLVGAIEAAFTETYAGGIPMASFGSTGSALQDEATVRAFRRVIPWWFNLLGINSDGAQVAFHHWMGPFPLDSAQARSIIEKNTVTAKNVMADKVVTKTVDEALGIPTNTSNADAVRLVKGILETPLLNVGVTREVEEESQFLEAEVVSQLERLAKESSDIREIVLASVAKGFVDPPFSPHNSAIGAFKAIRANDGTLRVSSDFCGNTSADFVRREAAILGSRSKWSQFSADEIAQQIKWPGT